MSGVAPERRIASSAGGAIGRGRRHLGLLLGCLAMLMLLVAVLAVARDRWGAGVVALLAGIVPLVAWRLAIEAGVLWLEVEAGELTVQLKAGREVVALDGAAARRLTDDEIAYLARLASTGGIVSGSGAYDTRRLGTIDLYATDLSHAVLVRGAERAVVVTPDEPERFIQQLVEQGARVLTGR